MSVTMTAKVTEMEPLVNINGKDEEVAEDSIQRATNAGNRTRFLIRLLYLTYYMAVNFLQPFMPVYYQSLGYGGMIIGFLGSITPFTTFLVGPIWGMISDRTGSRFAVLYVTILVSLVGQIMVGMIDNAWYIMLLVFLKSIFGAPIKSLMDSLVIDQLEDRTEYGKLRLWSLIGTGIGTGIAGTFLNDEMAAKSSSGSTIVLDSTFTLVDYFMILWRSLSGYRVLFFVHFLLHIPALICIRSFQIQDRANKSLKTAENHVNGKSAKPTIRMIDMTAYLFRDMETILFFATVFAMGMSGALAENFSYVRFREVGANGSDMGLSRLYCSLAGAAMFWKSKEFADWLGMENVMIVSVFSVAVRFALYVIMDHPYYGFVAEILRGLTFGCFWSTSTVYASQIAPSEARATVLQLLNGTYNGIGRSAGAILGGHLQSNFGTRTTFLYGAVANAVLTVVLVGYGKFWKNSLQQGHGHVEPHSKKT